MQAAVATPTASMPARAIALRPLKRFMDVPPMLPSRVMFFSVLSARHVRVTAACSRQLLDMHLRFYRSGLLKNHRTVECLAGNKRLTRLHQHEVILIRFQHDNGSGCDRN